MCKYCENCSKPLSELKLGDIFIISNAKYTEVGDGAPHTIPTVYCPACGEKIKRKIVE